MVRWLAVLLAKLLLRFAGVKPREIARASLASENLSVILVPEPNFVLRVDFSNRAGAPAPADIRIALGDEKLSPSTLHASRDGLGLSVWFELPGYWWQLCSSAQSAPVLVVGSTSIALAGGAADVRWGLHCLTAMAICRPADAHLQVLAIEHAGFLLRHGKPGIVARRWLIRSAAVRGLSSWLPPGLTAGARAVTRVDLLQQQVSEALRAFNKAIPANRGSEAALLRTSLNGLSGIRLRQRLLGGVLPWLLREGLFDAARPLVSRVHVERLAWSRNARSASLSLPFLVVAGRLGRAARVLRALPRYEGWVVTESLAEASRRALAGDSPVPVLEQFGHALMALIDSWASDYWGRSEDEQLIDAFAAWLRDPARFSVGFQDELLQTALRVYGLSPAFWQRIRQLPGSEDIGRRRLAEAEQKFRRIVAAVRALKPDDQFPRGMVDDLAFFRQSGAIGADRFLREATCFQLANYRGDGNASGAPVAELLALGEVESLRMAALPGWREDVVPDALDVMRISASIAALQRGVVESPQAPLERELAAQVDVLNPHQLDAFLRNVALLAKGDDSHLSTDLLAAAWCRLGDLGDASLSDLLARLLLRATGSGSAPPQPLLAAVARLAGDLRLRRTPMLARAVAETRELLERRYPLCRQSLAKVAGSGDMAFAPGRNDDVLVVIYSCGKYLDTRIPAIRATWLKNLSARGVPYVILAGDGDGTLDGDVLRLAVSDRYEDLPKKTLAMVEWVLANTSCQYLFKIDDDCFLNVDAWLDDPAFRKFHYHGRVLRPGKRAQDRRWHQEKSQGALARHALDKSPDGSVYADGGCGYSLSRLAMMQMVSVSATGAGKRLLDVSFMEDKLVGDLLALSGITCGNEGFYVLVRRCIGRDAEPVNVSPNTFFPSRSCPVKVAHLDTPDHMALARERLADVAIWPKKLWPCDGLPALDHATANQLELLTPSAQARSLLAGELFVIAVFRNERALVPYFLAHYRSLGVQCFLFVDNLSDDGTREWLLAQPDVVLYSADTEYRHSQYGVVWQQALLAQHCLNKWALVVDADEFALLPGKQLLPDYVKELARGGYDVARMLMVDMYPFSGLEDADVACDDPFAVAPWFDARPVLRWRLGVSHYSNTDVHTSALRHRVTRATAPAAFHVQKFCLIRYAPWMRFSAGLHCAANVRVAPGVLWIAHFKYHAGFGSKVVEEVARRQHSADAQEYRWYQETLGEISEKGIGVQGLSMRYSPGDGFSHISVDD